MNQWIIKIQWNKKWNTTVIMAGVHGNERSGIDAFKNILATISVSSWVVYFILANLKAIEKNVRFVEKNMNRCFRKRIVWNSYEELRVRKIKKILNKADYLLDVHNTTNTVSEPFLIWEEKKLAKYFPVRKFLSWIDWVQKWGSDGYMYNRWKIWLCIESGSIYDNQWPWRAEISILNFLKITANIVWKPEVFGKDQVKLSCYKIYKSKTDNFVLAKKFKDFENIEKWEIIWYDWGNKVIAEKKWAILFAHDADQKWKECFVLTVYK
jgi:hypothetical protein